MSNVDLTADQRDALQEVANIGMGQAGAALAGVLGTFVNLSVPRVQVVDVPRLSQTLCAMIGMGREVTAVRQSFRCDIRGEAFVIYEQGGCADLWDLMGYERGDGSAETVAVERELLFDIANVLVGACICSVFEQLGRTLTFSPPTLMAANLAIERLLAPNLPPGGVALLLEVTFGLESRRFSSHLLMVMPEDSIGQMKCALDHFLASL